MFYILSFQEVEKPCGCSDRKRQKEGSYGRAGGESDKTGGRKQIIKTTELHVEGGFKHTGQRKCSAQVTAG